MQASWVSGSSGMPSEANDLPYGEWEWAAATTSGRAWWMAEWITNAARFTGWSPYTTSPWWLTRIRSLTRMWRKLSPNGLTQKWSGNSGIAHRDVPGDALAEPEPPEDAQRAGELLLAVQALLLDGLERRRPGELHGLRRERDAVDRRDVAGVATVGVRRARS